MPSQNPMTTPLFNVLRRLRELIWPDAQPAPAYIRPPTRREQIPIRRSGPEQPAEWRPLWRGPQSRRRNTGPLNKSDQE
jgi:hypothetical protein